ncbi:TPA: hypothetical protein ACHK19_005079, partial [Escherichia coli]
SENDRARASAFIEIARITATVQVHCCIMFSLGLYAGNAEIPDTVNLLIFEACLASFDVYVYGAVSEKLSVPAM